MMEIIGKVLKNVLTVFYQYMSISLVIAFLSIIAYVYFKDHGVKEGCIKIREFIRTEQYGLNKFLFIVYISLVLCKTIFCRGITWSPLKNIIGVWDIYGLNGELNTECIENIILFIPMMILLLPMYKRVKSNTQVLKLSLSISGGSTLCIEFLQLFLRVGTFQLSDLIFNIIGGILGGIIYIIFNYIGKKWRKSK